MELTKNLPGLIRSGAKDSLKEELKATMDGLDKLKEYVDGIEKTTIDLLKWRNRGMIVTRDEYVALKWANAVLELTNSDNSASFERLVSTCLWCLEAFVSAARKEAVKKFLGKNQTV